MEDSRSVSFVLVASTGVVAITVGILLLIFLHTQPKITVNNNSVNNNWATGSRESMVKHMAPRLGITEAAMLKELASGKTMIQVISEHQKNASATTVAN